MPFRIRGFGDFDSVLLSVIPSEIEESLILSERGEMLDFARYDKRNHFRSATIKFASL
jgi:hypothetical protein